MKYLKYSKPSFEMTYFFILFFLLSSVVASTAQSTGTNLALHLDGKDNNVKTGIRMLNGSWTLETWIKGNDKTWNKLEVIFGGGEYSQLNITDNLPLVIQNGRLHNTKADLWSREVLDDQWHHVALSCDGSATRLYLDGEVVDSKPVAISVLPGALGINEGDSTVFGGLIDEVRVWDTALSAETLREWMLKLLAPTHPDFKTLVAYYNFDDGIDDVSVNWVGKGDQAYHIRNGRNDYKGTIPMAYTVVNDNPKFISNPNTPRNCSTP